MHLTKSEQIRAKLMYKRSWKARPSTLYKAERAKNYHYSRLTVQI